MGTFTLVQRNANLDAYYRGLQAKHEREYVEQPHVAGVTAGGDERRLRGIPAIGRGVQGAIPGTNPENAAAA